VLVINACRNICSASYTETARKVLGLAIAEYVLHGPIGVGAARAWSVLRDVIVARRSTFFVSLRGWSVQLVRYHSFCRATLCWRGIQCRRVSVRPSVRLSVTRRYCTKTVRRKITQTTPYDSSWDSSLLVPKISAKFPRGYPQRERQIEVG